jgi:hypothetical protein
MGAPRVRAQVVTAPSATPSAGSSAADSASDLERRLAEAEARVEDLERVLERRSTELVSLMALLDEVQLRALARILAGRPVATLEELRNPFTVDGWNERAELEPAEVPEALQRLWETVAEESLV